MQEGFVPSVRDVKDAPQKMRIELVDLFFFLAEKAEKNALQQNKTPPITPSELRDIISHSLGVMPYQSGEGPRSI